MNRPTLCFSIAILLALGLAPAPIVAAAAGAAPAAAAPPAASQQKAARILPDFKKEVLGNGLVVLVAEKKGLPLVSIDLILRTGSTSDPAGKEGLASLTLELARHGAGARNAAAFDEAIESLGARLATGADLDSCTVSAEFMSRHFGEGLGLLGDLVQRPAFTAEEFDRTRAKALAELVQDLEDPSTVVSRRFMRFLFGAHPYGRPVAGTPASLNRLTREDVTSFHARHFVPSNAILAIVGDVDPAAAVGRAREVFGGWPARPAPKTEVSRPEPVRGRRVLIVDRADVNQTQIRIGTVGIARSDPDYFPVDVANTILGVPFTSWLNQEIREKRGLSYGASSGFAALRQPGPIVVDTFTRNERLGEAVEASLATIQRLQSGGCAAEDLSKAHNYRAGTFPLSLETSNQVAAALVEMELYGLSREFYDRQVEKIRAVTLEDIARAGKLFPVENAVIVVVSPASTARPVLERFGPVTVEPLEEPGEKAPEKAN